MYKRLELHNHTTESDASFTCRELVDFFLADGVDGFALTDHNTISGNSKMRRIIEEERLPIGFIPGMEYTTYYGRALAVVRMGVGDLTVTVSDKKLSASAVIRHI